MTRPDKQPCYCEPLDIKERNGHTAKCNRNARKFIQIAKEKARRKQTVIKAMRKVSPKMAIGLKEYLKQRDEWIKGKMCALFPTLPATDCHHQKGRATIELLLNKDYWLPVSRQGHDYIHNHPQEALEKGWSLSRLAKEEPIKPTI